MKTFKLPSLFCLLLLYCCLGCQKKQSVPDPDLVNIELLRGDIILCSGKQFGEVSFPQSCKSTTRKNFELGVSMLHSFEYEQAEKAFVKVIDEDPDCVMAYWGVAMSNFHSLWMQSGNGHLVKGERVLQIAAKLDQSEKERDYLDAIGAFYHEWDKVDHKSRIARFEKKMEALYKKYEGDKEAAIFYALALTASANPADKTYANQRKSGKILEALFADNPNHPGIAHYIIHNYDYPELAQFALPTARRYAAIAPASSHAQHMPSHIFTRLGLWEESITSNINSTASALCYSESIDPEAHWDEELHGMDYLVYAYLQQGDNQKAREQHDYLKTFKKVFPANFKISYSAAAIPARIALENRDWKSAAALQLPAALEINWEEHPWQKAILHYARALGAIHTGKLEAAEAELQTLQQLKDRLTAAKDTYKANQVAIQEKTVQAWLQYARGHHNESVALMSEAALMEYKTEKHPVTPGEVLPAGELLGDLYLKLKKYPEALQAYENDLKVHPNRFNGVYGAALAAKGSDERQKAKSHFEHLLKLTGNVNSDRVEIAEAKKYLTIS